MRRSLLVFIAISFSLGLSGQVITVLDPNLRPIEAATISTTNNQNWVTDKFGKVELNLNSAKRVFIQHVSHQSKEIWLEPDQTIRVVLEPKIDQLSDVVVEGFTDEETLSRQAGSIGKIGPSEFSRFDQMSLVSAVNLIPGVGFEERAGASYRVSIRGSSVRSPFGVRNVKVYWNGVPFTEPGGNTFLNVLDLTNVGDLEIIKGPAGSAYGAGNGGVMKIKSTNLSKLSNGLSFGLMSGAYGNFRTNLQSNWLSERVSLTTKYAYQQSDGYRDHNEMNRFVGEVDFMYFQNDNVTWSASALYSDLFYEIPGGLNPTQLAENRRQARPGSENFNASIDHKYFLLLGGQEYEQTENFRSNVDVYYYRRDFENPFNLDYKSDFEHSLGYRLQLENDFRMLGRESSFTYGNEFQIAYFEGKNFGNIGGRADTLRFLDNLQNRISFWFADAKLNLTESLKLTLGASLNSINYDINRLEDKINNTPGRVVRNFDKVVSPRVALSKIWSEYFNTHFSVSHGYSPPTTTEIRTNEGTLNLALAPELGVNYELNFRGSLLQRRLSYDLTLFVFNLDESITTMTDGQGVVLFRNSGQLDQKGIEATLDWNWLNSTSTLLSNLNTRMAYTHHDFKFKNYVSGGDDLSGKALPGTAPNVISLTTDIGFNSGLYANFTFQYSDEIPLNEENTFFSEAYQLIQTRVGYRKGTKRVDYEFFGGVDNLFNEQYSLGNDLNAFGKRYFQPAPERNFYFGLNLKLNYLYDKH